MTHHHEDLTENLELATLEAMESLAYMNDQGERAAMLRAIIDLRERLEAAEAVETIEKWEERNGPADAYMAFFFDCFERLDKPYPCPSVTSDYDKGVIFDIIDAHDSHPSIKNGGEV